MLLTFFYQLKKFFAEVATLSSFQGLRCFESEGTIKVQIYCNKYDVRVTILPAFGFFLAFDFWLSVSCFWFLVSGFWFLVNYFLERGVGGIEGYILLHSMWLFLPPLGQQNCTAIFWPGNYHGNGSQSKIDLFFLKKKYRFFSTLIFFHHYLQAIDRNSTFKFSSGGRVWFNSRILPAVGEQITRTPRSRRRVIR